MPFSRAFRSAPISLSPRATQTRAHGPLLGLCLLGLTLAGCATPSSTGPSPSPLPQADPQARDTDPSHFNPNDAIWSLGEAERGQGYRPTILTGQAYIPAQTGKTPSPAFSCAGVNVALMPDTPYTRWRMEALYGSNHNGKIPLSALKAKAVPAPPLDLNRFVRTTQCDQKGNFNFGSIPSGTWYVITQVRPQTPQGGKDAPEALAVMGRITLIMGAPAKIKLPE